MKDYSGYDVEDFLTDDDFIDWVKRPNEQSNQFWQQLMSDAALAEKIRLAVSTLKAFRFQSTPVPDDFYSSLKEKIDNTIQQSTASSFRSRVLSLDVWMKVAAVFILVIGAAFLLYQSLRPAETILLATTYKEVKTFELPDHSTVTLNANSSIEYPKDWSDNNRNVTLKGEGFFKVTHIENNTGVAKFTVHASAVHVAVLGTEFNVKNRNENTSVMLQSGKVQLTVDGVKDPALMKPNDFVTVNQRTRNIAASVVNPSYHTAWLNHKYVFSKVSLKEACNHLEDFYGLHFVIKDTALANQEISGTLLLEDEGSLLQTLSSLLKANIEQQGQQVIISSKK